MRMKLAVTLGCEAKDTISGFTGIAIAVTEWLNGCVRITIAPRELKDGRPIDSGTFDIEQVEYVGPGVEATRKPTGGDRTSITIAFDPTR